MIGSAADDWLPWLWLLVALCTLGGFGYGFVKWAREQFRDAAVHDVKPVIDEAIKPIMAELHPNGGASMRDAVNRTEAKVDAAAAKVEEVNVWRAGVDVALRNIQQAQVPDAEEWSYVMPIEKEERTDG